ncbi:MAG: hypothetical protein EVJ46_08055 [Candidatus Acididesulfobacter guangdongensis]|uniref:Type IV secretion system protein n=1 Tax=Acididesulfobacter guangdongensis TaxID=2597225 RepID=A0A519BFT4_ACIG2|nr:MAG: hypothetical protein EVJ46_08055 [Candidatus Acididesulfobacter guangdongensis]
MIKKYILIFMLTSVCFLTAEFLNTGSAMALTAGGSSGTSSVSNSGSNLNSAKLNSSSLSISKLNNGEDLTILSIDSIPDALNKNSSLVQLTTYLFYFLFASGIVFSLWESYKLELTGQSANYYGLFLKTVLIAIGFLSWKSAGLSNFAQDILSLADKIQLYIIKLNIYSIGQNVSQINSSIVKSLHSVSLPTISSNGTASVQKGWNLNPVSWFAGALHALTGAVLMGIFWFIFNILYVGIQLFMALIQLVILGLLFSIFPIIIGFETIPYTKGVFSKWLKLFVEISFWGVMTGLEQLIFFTMLGKIMSANMQSTGTGLGQILGLFTFAEDIVIFVVMISISVSVPFLIGKIFDGLGDRYHSSIKQTITAAGKAIAS